MPELNLGISFALTVSECSKYIWLNAHTSFYHSRGRYIPRFFLPVSGEQSAACAAGACAHKLTSCELSGFSQHFQETGGARRPCSLYRVPRGAGLRLPAPLQSAALSRYSPWANPTDRPEQRGSEPEDYTRCCCFHLRQSAKFNKKPKQNQNYFIKLQIGHRNR